MARVWRPNRLACCIALLTSVCLCGCRPSSSSGGLDPKVVETMNRGVSLMGQYDYEQAAQSFELKGIILQHVGKAETAIECFQKATQARPEDAVAWYLLGLCKQRVGQSAEADLLRAVELRPNLCRAYYQLDQTALRAGEDARARSYLEQFQSLRESPLGEPIELPQFDQMGELALVQPPAAQRNPPVARSRYQPAAVRTFPLPPAGAVGELLEQTGSRTVAVLRGDVDGDRVLDLVVLPTGVRSRHCQDCHMPRLNEPIKIGSRPPWLGPRAPFWRHPFVGGNAFMLTMLGDRAGPFEANAEPAQFDRMIALAREQLARSATVTARGRRVRGELVLRVEVKNLTGHTFPTGHPYRRAWLHVRISDAAGRLVFESGAVDERGRLRASEAKVADHLDVITQAEQVQVYEAAMGDAAGQPTHSLLRAATYLKDNRLPPQGFQPDGPETVHTAIRGGAEQDPNFNARGSGSEEVRYRVRVGDGRGPWVAEVALLYQSVPPEAVATLLESRRPAAQEFSQRYLQADHRPETVPRVRLKIQRGVASGNAPVPSGPISTPRSVEVLKPSREGMEIT